MATKSKKRELNPRVAALVESPKEDKTVIIESATGELPEDTEDLLRKLEEIKERRYQWTSDKGVFNLQYEELRDAGAEALMNGPRYFIDNNGVKMVAVRRQAFRMQVNETLLDHLPEAVIDKIAPRKIDNEQLKRAVQRGDIPDALTLRYVKLVPSTPFVEFIVADTTPDE